MRQDLVDALELISKDLYKATVYYINETQYKIVECTVEDITFTYAGIGSESFKDIVLHIHATGRNRSIGYPSEVSVDRVLDNKLIFFSYGQAKQKLIELLTERREELLRG